MATEYGLPIAANHQNSKTTEINVALNDQRKQLCNYNLPYGT